MISIFPLRTFHLYVATFQQHLHMEYTSQLIRYSRACGSYQNCLDRRLPVTRKLLNQGFLLVKLKSSLQKFCGPHHDLVDCSGIYVSQMTMDMFHLGTCRKHFPVLSSFMIYHRVHVTRLTRRMPLVEQELPILPEHRSSPPVFSGVRVTWSLVLCMFCRSLFVLLYFLFWQLCCLFFFDIHILITPLVSSNSSWTPYPWYFEPLPIEYLSKWNPLFVLSCDIKCNCYGILNL
jgi:hypothetical protein